MLMDLIRARHSIRKYTNEQPHRKPGKPGRIKVIEQEVPYGSGNMS